MSKVPPIEEILSFLNEDERQNILPIALYETFLVIWDFLHRKDIPNKLAWACSSPPGHGKTTALKVVLKLMAKNQEKMPVLLAFNNDDNMLSFYNDVVEFGKRLWKSKLIQYVTTDNVGEVIDILPQFQFLCITHQRLKNIALGLTGGYAYGSYTYKEKTMIKKVPRKIVVDEMPFLFDAVDYGIGGVGNTVDWFDELAKEAKLTEQERKFGRSYISSAVSIELVGNSINANEKLSDNMGQKSNLRLEAILEKLKNTTGNIDARMKLHWFEKLLNNNNVGFVTDSIICSKKVDYRSLGNILILDGTSDITEQLYQDYEFQAVPNRHRYKERLHVHWRKITTSAKARDKGGVKDTIATDIKKLRAQGINPFPLMQKRDINDYIKNGTINHQQKSLFIKHDDEEGLPLNLLNTTGKNDLNRSNALAILNLPIRPPEHYLKIAISLYGLDINFKFAEKDQSVWFADDRLQRIYEEVTLAEIVQIIHRSSIRNIKDDLTVHIYLYHSRPEWQEKIKHHFGLPSDNVTEFKIFNKKSHHFEEKCVRWAQHVRQQIINNPEMFSNKTANDFGSTFRKWINNNANKEDVILEIFNDNGVDIYKDSNRWRRFRLIEDSDPFI